MAREINWDEELSPEDREWAEQRPDMPAGNGMTVAQRLAEQDGKFGDKRVARSRAERIEELRGIIANSQNELERLLVEEEAEANANAAFTGDPASGVVRDFTPVDGQTPDGAPAPTDDYDNEKVWTKAKLIDEIKARNTERVEQQLEPLSTNGTRSELVDRIRKDDSELEG